MKDFISPDGAPFACSILLQDDPPRFWTRCEKESSHVLDQKESADLKKWLEENPRAILHVYPGEEVRVCKVHKNTVEDILGVGIFSW